MRTVAEIGDPDVSAITRQTIIAYRGKLLDAGKAVNTINSRTKTLHSAAPRPHSLAVMRPRYAPGATMRLASPYGTREWS